jgi:hypothetical protein
MLEELLGTRRPGDSRTRTFHKQRDPWGRFDGLGDSITDIGLLARALSEPRAGWLELGRLGERTRAVAGRQLELPDNVRILSLSRDIAPSSLNETPRKRRLALEDRAIVSLRARHGRFPHRRCGEARYAPTHGGVSAHAEYAHGAYQARADVRPPAA